MRSHGFTKVYNNFLDLVRAEEAAKVTKFYGGKRARFIRITPEFTPVLSRMIWGDRKGHLGNNASSI